MNLAATGLHLTVKLPFGLILKAFQEGEYVVPLSVAIGELHLQDRLYGPSISSSRRNRRTRSSSFLACDAVIISHYMPPFGQESPFGLHGAYPGAFSLCSSLYDIFHCTGQSPGIKELRHFAAVAPPSASRPSGPLDDPP